MRVDESKWESTWSRLEDQEMFPWGSDTWTDKQELSGLEVMVVSILDQRKHTCKVEMVEVRNEICPDNLQSFGKDPMWN